MLVECDKCSLRWVSKSYSGSDFCELCGAPATAVTKVLEPSKREALDKTLDKTPDTLEK